ncbi:hypothetical protein GCM10022394_12190 [Zobellella aerophila]|uniref:Uncharacterized protein n=1 Tax=Zobellella aerophila TaxID=870480 RepID=A0ABP6VE94_9GAMM
MLAKPTVDARDGVIERPGMDLPRVGVPYLPSSFKVLNCDFNKANRLGLISLTYNEWAVRYLPW